jgi:hypothetical protein
MSRHEILYSNETLFYVKISKFSIFNSVHVWFSQHNLNVFFQNSSHCLEKYIEVMFKKPYEDGSQSFRDDLKKNVT